MKKMNVVKKYFAPVFAGCSAFFVSASAVLATTTSAVTFDVEGKIKPLFSTVGADLQSFIVIILGVLAVLWVGRKFIKVVNGS